MNISEELKKHVPEKTTNKALAAQWREVLEDHTGEKLSQDGVESRLSDLFAGKKTGFRFFFLPEKRADVTTQVFNIPEPERPELKRRVLGKIGQGMPLVFDLTVFEMAPNAAFEAIRAFQALGAPRIVVLLSTRQFDAAPPSFREGDFDLRRIDDGAVDERKRLLADGAVVASESRVASYEQWLAFSHENGKLEVDPPDGVERVAEQRPFEPLPVIDRPLKLIATPKETWLPRLESIRGPSLRRLWRALAVADEEQIKTIADVNGASTRLVLAEKLGVSAAATLTEWSQARGATPWSAEELAKLNVIARHDSRAKLVTDGEGVFHAFNPNSEMETKLASPLFAGCTIVRHTERVDGAKTLAGIRDAVWQLSADDALDDPFLLKLVTKLSGGDPGRAFEVHHAIVYLAAAQELPTLPVAPVETDWADGLKRLLASADPMARLKLSNRYGPKYDFEVVHPAALPERPPTVASVTGFLPLFDVTVSREQPLVRRTIRRPDGSRRSDEDRRPDERSRAAVWQTSIAHELASTMEWQARNTSSDRDQPFEIEKNRWHEADDQLACTALALRAALERGRSAPLPHGWHLLELSGGLFARVQVRRHGHRSAPVSAAVLQPYGPRDSHSASELDGFERLLIQLSTNAARSGSDEATSGPLAPRALRFSGKGLVADVIFGAAGLLSAGPGRSSEDTAATLVRKKRKDRRSLDD